ncbi:diguanylate cyclase (GGDEF)-like protein [Ureibacillus xyleni]|uniref:Diguanylate cyclase (GGDEF)-like protein n=1 Tax=Ureibacillus xyleni TaxID=614648 RepID=A0A285SN83_9BACL|nr:response regulator [Ureibacillus xyleni]SOC09532.1 diguanylate cyclase (GGDEF)-like protein [Ureibacillus xyleni]
MNLQKYKSLLFQNIKQNLSKWFDSNEYETIPSTEVYRFLHSLKGTSGTLNLNGLAQLSIKLLEQLDEKSEFNWHKQELKDYLFKLIELSYQYEHFEEEVSEDDNTRDPQKPLIQVIDDDVSMLILLKDSLEENGWMVITSVDPEKAVEQYYQLKPDCLIIDYQLPTKLGFEALKEIQQHIEKYFIPRVIISVNNDKETRIKAYQNGADDFIAKPIELDEFLVRVERHLYRKQMFDQSVLIDELTQVYNRKFLEDNFSRLLQDYKRTGQAFVVSILDLDHFKKVNDTYGHLTGDLVLKEFAQFLKEQVRNVDRVYRIGGEEFIITFPRSNENEVKKLLTNLIEEFSEKLFTYEDTPFSISFSAGIYTVNDLHIPLKTAIREADAALYEAKRLGRARVECSKVNIDPSVKKVLNISVVDDDIIIRSILGKLLSGIQNEQLDINIGIYEDGPSFLKSDSAQNGEEHFLILDGMMPGMDGLEVLQAVKAGENSDKFTVLMLTGRKREEDIARALKLGADDYVTKPFSTTELEARITRLLKRVN